jgi:hypothetical protein
MLSLPYFKTAAFASVLMLLGGCASVTVKDIDHDRGAIPAGRPAQFAVQPYAVDAARVRENPMRKHPGQLGSDAQQLLQGYLVAELQKLGVSAIASGTNVAPRQAWIVSGVITRVAEGNRLLRMGIGLGMGGTKMETITEVRTAPGAPPFLHFGTTGGSNATPGAATMPIPFSGLPTALMNSKDGVTADAARTARMIAARIVEYLAEHGWFSGEKPRLKRARS